MYEPKKWSSTSNFSNSEERERGKRETKGEARYCVWKYTYVLIFISPSSQLLIINVIDLMVYKGGSRVNHLFDGLP